MSDVDIFRNVANLQTADGNVLSGNGSFFSAELASTVPNAYTSASFTPPGGVITPLSALNTTTWNYASPGLADKAALDLAFPTGSYFFSATNGGPADTTSITYLSDSYAGAAPFLTGTDYSSLQGLNSTQAFTAHFNSFTSALSGPNNSAFVFFTVYDYTLGTFVFNAGFQPSTTTSVLLPANTLAAGHQFAYEIDFSNRLGVVADGTEFGGFIGFESRTTGLFETTARTVAAPEPSTAALVGFALLGVAGLSRRAKSRKKSSL